MPEQPFGPSTWALRSSIPNLPLNGVYSGLVQGPINASYDKKTGVIQSFSRQAHHFNGFASTSQASVDNGISWVTTFNEGLANTVVLKGWSLPHPSFPSKRLHFQVRWSWVKAFLIADGSILSPGGIDLYASENGTSYSFLQRIHSWPAINQIGGDGGAALMNSFPSCTDPILLPETGPDGEDAYWIAASHNFEAGGAGNRTTFKQYSLHRSVDGGISWEVVRDMEPVVGSTTGFAEFARSHTGRIFLSTGVGPAFYTDEIDLEVATFAAGSAPGLGVRGSLITMFGGTLLTHANGSLIAGGNAWISCDDGATYFAGEIVVPVNQTGHLVKLGASEALIVAPGFNDPSTETASYYTDDGGETFQVSDPWIASSVGESPVMIALQASSRPIVITRSGSCYVSGDTARGTTRTRTLCPLANAGLLAAAPVRLCGAPVSVNQCI